MNRIYLLFTILIIICSCSKNHTKNSTRTITNQERIQSIKKNFIETPFVSYRGIPLNCNTQFADSILAKDTMSNILNHRCYMRNMKLKENDEEYLYETIGFGESYYPISARNENIMKHVKDLQKRLRQEVPWGKTLLDTYLHHCYSGELIVPIIENEDTIYQKNDGWFSYNSFKDSVYSVTFVTEFIEKHNNLEDTRNFEILKNSIIQMYDSKYGIHKQSEKVYYTYWFKDKYKNFENSLYDNNELFDIIESVSWLIGQYEIQLCINKTFNDLLSRENKYEIIIRYINNDFIFKELDHYNKLKKVFIEKRNKERKEAQITLKKELEQQSF